MGKIDLLKQAVVMHTFNPLRLPQKKILYYFMLAIL